MIKISIKSQNDQYLRMEGVTIINIGRFDAVQRRHVLTKLCRRAHEPLPALPHGPNLSPPHRDPIQSPRPHPPWCESVRWRVVPQWPHAEGGPRHLAPLCTTIFAAAPSLYAHHRDSQGRRCAQPPIYHPHDASVVSLTGGPHPKGRNF
jgi:hypothetical protein